MPSSAAPYGLLPLSDQTGFIRPVRIPNGIASGLSSNIFKGQPVKLDVVHGTITPITGATDPIFAVFAGVEYAPVGGRPAESPFWPSGVVPDTGLDFFVYVWPAWIPNIRWAIQADGSVAQTGLGRQFNLSNFAAGSTTTGLSAATAAATPIVAGQQGQLALVEFGVNINDAVGDAFTDLIVTIARPQIGGAPQVGF